MGKQRSPHHIRFLLFCLILAFPAGAVHANPVGPQVSAGSAAVSGLGTSKVTIHQATPQAIINWRQFNIAPNEVTQFIQPSASAIALNRIADVNPSQIFGSLQANGSVILLNPNGILFGPNAQVNVGGIVASSLRLSDQQFLSGQYRFEGAATNGPVINAGTISAGKNGVYLFAPNVENSGVITSPEGQIALAAGTSAYLSNRPDGRGLLVEVKAPAGEALNIGQLIADGGQVSMVGQAVNQKGLVQANSVREKNGRVELYASDRLTLSKDSRTTARGGDGGVSDGGTVIALADKSKGQTTFERGAVIDVSGGKQGGNAGFAEVSGKDVALGGTFKGQAAAGYRGGHLLIDPEDVTVDSNYLANFAGSGMEQIDIQATRDINVTAQFDLTDAYALAPGKSGTITFNAGNDLSFKQAFIFNDAPAFTENIGDASIAGSKWSLVGTAGNDILVSSSNLWMGRGGGIELTAARDIRLVQLGGPTYVWTKGGGSVSLNAGRDISAPSGFDGAFLQQMSGVRLDGAGDVTMTAGRDILGGLLGGQLTGPGFVLSNGKATVTAGGKIGDPDAYANITVGKAQIEMNAQGDVYVGQIQDKGVLGESGAPPIVTMDPTNRVAIISEQGNIHLKPSFAGTRDLGLGGIYPASFKAEAKQGSIIFDSDLVKFWPSRTGSLELIARDDIKGTTRLVDGEDPNFVPPQCNGRTCTEVELRQQGFTLEQIRKLTTPPIIKVIGSPTSIQLIPADPDTVVGQPAGGLDTVLPRPASNQPPHDPAPIRIETQTGDISTFFLNLFSGGLKKEVNIISGRDIKEFIGVVPVPVGVTATVSAERNIDMTKIGTGESGLQFIGEGTGRIIAKGKLDLADSSGITHRLDRAPSGLTNQGGLIDITVGGSLEMTRSKIFTYNGAGIFIHGQGDEAVQTTPGTFVGNELFAGGKRILGIEGPLPDSLPVITQGSFLLSNGRPVLQNGQPIRIGKVLLADGKAVEYQGKLLLFFNNKLRLVDPAIVREVKAIGGGVNVGTNAATGADAGIVTVRGGNIDIKATGDVNVNQSRVATLGGGDISVRSLGGDINAGFGGRNEAIDFVLREPVIDPVTGEQLKDQTGVLLFNTSVFRVPGSGIFTFHPDDPPFPLNFPKFDTPEMTAIKNEIVKMSFLGRNTSALSDKLIQLTEARALPFERTFDQFVAPLKLGDIALNAGRDVVVPPAGIRGRKILIKAGRNLDLQGGTIEGQTSIEAGAIKGDTTRFIGNFNATTSSGTTGGSNSGGGGTVAPLSGTTAATAPVSATASTSSTASGNTSSMQESNSETGAAASTVAARAVARTMARQEDLVKRKPMRVKQGVTIQVDVKAKGQ